MKNNSESKNPGAETACITRVWCAEFPLLKYAFIKKNVLNNLGDLEKKKIQLF